MHRASIENRGRSGDPILPSLDLSSEAHANSASACPALFAFLAFKPAR